MLAADIAAALAVRLDAGLNWDLVDVRDDGGSLVGVRPALGDSVYVDTSWRSKPAIALFRAGSFDPAPAEGAGEVADVVAELEDFSTAATLTGHDTEEQAGPPSRTPTSSSPEDAASVGRRASRSWRSSPRRSAAP